MSCNDMNQGCNLFIPSSEKTNCIVQAYEPTNTYETTNNNQKLIIVLYDLMFYWQKKEVGDTMSAESHFCQAFTRLMKIQPQWQPYDEESKEFVEYAKALMNKSGFKP